MPLVLLGRFLLACLSHAMLSVCLWKRLPRGAACRRGRPPQWGRLCPKRVCLLPDPCGLSSRQSGTLKTALLDYIKRCRPGDSEKHNMIALCFSMCREIGENHEAAANVQLKLIESQPWGECSLCWGTRGGPRSLAVGGAGGPLAMGSGRACRGSVLQLPRLCWVFRG